MMSTHPVMIIDDSAITRTILEVMLRRKGIASISFADGVEALSALKQQPELLPAVIILDIGLPRLDGYVVAKVLRARLEMAHIPIVMLSGRAGVIDRLKGRLAGADVYLTKPFTTQTILAVVSRYVTPAPRPV